MKRIYVAGLYSIPANVTSILDNIRRGMRAGLDVFLAGYAPFVPWFDFHFQLMLREDKGEVLTVNDYYAYSLAWLEASDAMLVISGIEEKSVGVAKEIERAQELGIPIFMSLEELKQKLPA